MAWLISKALMDSYANSHSSPEQAAESLAENCLDGEPCALWSGTRMQRASWLPAKTTKRLSLSRSGMTYRLLTDDLGADVLTSFLADFPVRTLVQPEKVQESTVSGRECGHTWRALSVRFDPVSCSWKTAQCLWDEDLLESSVILPRWGMTVGGECWERMTWVRPMSVSACGSWPTPTVCGNYNRKGLSKTSGDGLATAVKKKTWPTPQAHKTTRSGEIVNVDGTPWDGIRKPHSKTTGRQITTALADAVAHGGDQTQPTTLNPNWVEWLMGWPVGWTDLKPLGTDKYRLWLQQHGGF